MSDGIYSALTGALAQTRHLATLSNNLANIETTGYKADRLTFREVLSNVTPMETTFQASAAILPLRLLPDDKRFVETQAPEVDLAQGALRETGNTLDLAIGGRGFFVVETQAGQRYTRDGSFRADAEGRLVTSGGDPVQAVGGGDLLLSPGEVSIERDGTVSVAGEEVGQLEVVDLANPTKAGNAIFSGAPVALDPAAYDLRQGWLERSNVNPIAAMTQLITVHRTFEVLQSAMTNFRQMDGKAATQVGKPSD